MESTNLQRTSIADGFEEIPQGMNWDYRASMEALSEKMTNTGTFMRSLKESILDAMETRNITKKGIDRMKKNEKKVERKQTRFVDLHQEIEPVNDEEQEKLSSQTIMNHRSSLHLEYANTQGMSDGMKALLRNTKKYFERLDVKDVDLTNEADSEIVIHILKKEAKGKKEQMFLQMSIQGLNIFKKNSDILFKGSCANSIFKELKHEFFKAKKEIFHFGEFGFKYYIILKGAVQLLIPKPDIAKEIEKKREEGLQTPQTAFFRRVVEIQKSPEEAGSKTMPSKGKKSIFKQIAQGFSESVNLTSQQEEKEAILEEIDPDEGITYEQKIEKHYKDWNQIKLFLPGGSFGEIALLTKQRRTGTMICAQDTHLMTLSKDAFDDIMGQYHAKMNEEKIRFLRKFQLFDGIPNSKLMSLLLDAKIETYQINNMLYEEGDPVDTVYFIQEGEVELSKIISIDEEEMQQQQSSPPSSSPTAGGIVVQPEDREYENKFQIFNMKWSRKLMREKQKQIRIALLTNGQSFGLHDVNEGSKKRTQRAVVTHENTLILSFPKLLLLDMLRTHKILDNIQRENSVNSSFHQTRETEIMTQSIRNQHATQQLVSQQFKEQLKNAIKFPDLSFAKDIMSMTTSVSVPIDGSPFSRKQQQQQSQQQVQQQNNRKSISHTQSPKSHSPSASPSGTQQLINGSNKLEVQKYQEFTSKHLRKTVEMKLNHDLNVKQDLLNKILNKPQTPTSIFQSKRPSLSSNLYGQQEQTPKSQIFNHMVHSNSFSKYKDKDTLDEVIQEDNKSSHYNNNSNIDNSRSTRKQWMQRLNNSTQQSSKFSSLSHDSSPTTQQQSQINFNLSRPPPPFIPLATQASSRLSGSSSASISPRQTSPLDYGDLIKGIFNKKLDEIREPDGCCSSSSGDHKTSNNFLQQSSPLNSPEYKSIGYHQRFNLLLQRSRESDQNNVNNHNNSTVCDSPLLISRSLKNSPDQSSSFIDSPLSLHRSKLSLQTPSGSNNNSNSNNNNNTSKFNEGLPSLSSNVSLHGDASGSRAYSVKSQQSLSMKDTSVIPSQPPAHWFEDVNLLSKTEKRRRQSLLTFQTKQILSENKLNHTPILSYIGNQAVTIKPDSGREAHSPLSPSPPLVFSRQDSSPLSPDDATSLPQLPSLKQLLETSSKQSKIQRNSIKFNEYSSVKEEDEEQINAMTPKPDAGKLKAWNDHVYEYEVHEKESTPKADENGVTTSPMPKLLLGFNQSMSEGSFTRAGAQNFPFSKCKVMPLLYSMLSSRCRETQQQDESVSLTQTQNNTSNSILAKKPKVVTHNIPIKKQQQFFLKKREDTNNKSAPIYPSLSVQTMVPQKDLIDSSGILARRKSLGGIQYAYIPPQINSRVTTQLSKYSSVPSKVKHSSVQTSSEAFTNQSIQGQDFEKLLNNDKKGSEKQTSHRKMLSWSSGIKWEVGVAEVKKWDAKKHVVLPLSSEKQSILSQPQQVIPPQQRFKQLLKNSAYTPPAVWRSNSSNTSGHRSLIYKETSKQHLQQQQK